MKEEKKLLGVAIPKVICPICEREFDFPGIIMNKRLGPKRAEKIEEMHGKVIGVSDTICSTCKEQTKDCLFAIGIKANPETKEVTKTGNIYKIPRTEHPAKNILSEERYIKFEQEHGFIYIIENETDNNNQQRDN